MYLLLRCTEKAHKKIWAGEDFTNTCSINKAVWITNCYFTCTVNRRPWGIILIIVTSGHVVQSIKFCFFRPLSHFENNLQLIWQRDYCHYSFERPIYTQTLTFWLMSLHPALIFSHDVLSPIMLLILRNAPISPATKHNAVQPLYFTNRLVLSCM